MDQKKERVGLGRKKKKRRGGRGDGLKEIEALFGTTYAQLLSSKSELIPPNSLRPSRDEKPRTT
jgi:hypothetical protein